MRDGRRETRVLIGGDTCPVGRNQKAFQDGNAAALLNDLAPHFEAADLLIVNLECPLISRHTPMRKAGPVLAAPRACAKGIHALGVDCVGVANNHIMDHGSEGMQSTIAALRAYGLPCVGAGANANEARQIHVHRVNDLRIGICAVAEHEFGIADEDAPGAAGIDLLEISRNIESHRSQFDCLIVLLHGGNEHYPYPRPGLMKTCRSFVDLGANAVICQHSHCIGCMEEYRGAPIIYGQGNFLFDSRSRNPAWNEGALVSFAIDNRREFRTDLVFFRQSIDGQLGASQMSDRDALKCRADFCQRSRAIREKAFVTEQWEAFCQKTKRYYLNSLHGKPGLLRRLFARLDWLHLVESADVQLARLNLIRCESHREALVTLLGSEGRRGSDHRRSPAV